MTEDIRGTDRHNIIVKTSIIGIAANVLLAAFKAGVGAAANSIAIVLDAVNNLSDALSSIITIVGSKLAAKEPTKKHPFGYGRIEYLSAMTVAGIVLYAGITSAVESVKHIIHPQKAEYDTVTLAVVVAAIAVKLVLGRYVRKQGERVDSGALIASGADASFDAILSASVLASALIYIYTGWALEAYVGVLISAVIIKAGVEMMMETVNDLLGQREDPVFILKLKELISSEPEVRGAYDLVIYDYGHNMTLGSVHLELPDTMSVKEVDALTRRLEVKVRQETGVILAAVGIYSHNTGSDKAADIEQDIRQRVLAHEWAVQMHGFYIDEETQAIRFDCVLSFDIPRQEALRFLYSELKEAYPDYSFTILPDVDISASV